MWEGFQWITWSSQTRVAMVYGGLLLNRHIFNSLEVIWNIYFPSRKIKSILSAHKFRWTGNGCHVGRPETAQLHNFRHGGEPIYGFPEISQTIIVLWRVHDTLMEGLRDVMSCTHINDPMFLVNLAKLHVLTVFQFCLVLNQKIEIVHNFSLISLKENLTLFIWKWNCSPCPN